MFLSLLDHQQFQTFILHVICYIAFFVLVACVIITSGWIKQLNPHWPRYQIHDPPLNNTVINIKPDNWNLEQILNILFFSYHLFSPLFSMFYFILCYLFFFFYIFEVLQPHQQGVLQPPSTPTSRDYGSDVTWRNDVKVLLQSRIYFLQTELLILLPELLHAL